MNLLVKYNLILRYEARVKSSFMFYCPEGLK